MNEAIPLNWRKYPERYRLEGSHCENCGKDFYPKRKICPDCRRKGKIIDKEMPRKGKVMSYSVVYAGHKDFEDENPYHIALVELDNGVKIFTQLVDSDDIEIGSRVKKVFRKINSSDGGVIAYGHKFKKIPDEQAEM